jgi:outer membrane protein assembly factor BamB
MFFSAFFNSRNGDRVYKAEDFADFFATFVGNGVFPNPSSGLQAQEGGRMQIAVRMGKAWINGYIFRNTSDHILTLGIADGMLPRIDRVVIRWSLEDRTITLAVSEGTPAHDPASPPITRNADVYELAIADVHIGAGVLVVTQEDLVDLRLNSELCGIVHGVIEQADTTDIFNQYQSWFQQFTEQQRTDFLAWIDGMKDVLDDIAIGNMLNVLSGKQDKITASGLLLGNGDGGVTTAEPGVDYIVPRGSASDDEIAFTTKEYIECVDTQFFVSQGVLHLRGDLTINQDVHEVIEYEVTGLNGNVCAIHMYNHEIALGTTTGKLYKINANTGEIVWSNLTYTRQVLDVKLTPSGAVYVNFGNEVSRHYADTGLREWVVPVAANGVISNYISIHDEDVFFLHSGTSENMVSWVEKRLASGERAFYTDLIPLMVNVSTQWGASSARNSGLVVTRDGECIFYTSMIRRHDGSTGREFQGIAKIRADGTIVGRIGTISYARGFLLGDRFMGFADRWCYMYNIDGTFQWQALIPVAHNLIVGLDNEENICHADTTRRIIMRFNRHTGTSEPAFTHPTEIFSFICGEPGDFFIGSVSSFKGYIASSLLFTTSQFETRKLINFEETLPISGSVPIRAFPDYNVAAPLYADFVLEVRANGIYLVASSQKAVPQGTRMRFSGAVPLSLHMEPLSPIEPVEIE